MSVFSDLIHDLAGIDNMMSWKQSTWCVKHRQTDGQTDEWKNSHNLRSVDE